MAQEFWDEPNQKLSKEVQEEMERAISVLERGGIDFVVEGNKIIIKCDAVYVDLDYLDRRVPSEEIVIFQGAKKVYISISSTFDIWIASGNVAVGLHNHIHVEYKDFHLIIEF